MPDHSNDKRYFLFDNMRAVLIILVVWGHLLTSLIFRNDVIKTIYYFIFFFHMPAMVFISGFFSKNTEKARDRAFKTILMPYLILNVCNYIFKMLILKEDYFGFRFFRPLWGLWYLLALFLWKFFLKDLIRIRFILPLSFLVGILSGFSKEFSTYMALGRVVCFLPFFLLGYYLKKEHIDKIKRIPRIAGFAVFIGSGVLSAVLAKNKMFGVEDLYLRSPYPEDADIEHMIIRVLVYVVALIMIFALINLTGSQKNFLTNIGQNTMTVYVLHLFTIPLLEKLKIFNNEPYLYLVYSVITTAIISYIYTLPIVKKIYDKAMNGSINVILLKDK